MRRTLSISAALIALTACAPGEADTSDREQTGVINTADAQAPDTLAQDGAATATRIGATAAPAGQSGSRSSAGHRELGDEPVRGLYVNRFAAQTRSRMARLLAIADSTEINAFVIDVKDEFGLNYESSDPEVAKNAGTMGKIRNMQALVDSMRAHNVIPIARIVVFKDSVAARVNPQHVIRRPDGSVWRDRPGLAWVNPYDRTIWEYNIRVAEEMARMGYEEIQFDYIRFPEPYKSLPQQVFPGADGMSKPDALAAFLREACPRVRRAGARCTIDVFGLTTTVRGALEIGQNWDKLSPLVDVMKPMTYPSHYPPGSFNIPRPNAEPYRIQYTAIKAARERDEALGLTQPERVRTWLQAFSLGQPPYGPEQIREQKRGVYDAGYDGWILWHPGSQYDQFLPGLDREATSRKKRNVASQPVTDTTAR